MKRAGKDFTYKVYPNCGHAFFNDTNELTYNKDAAEDSWARTLEFLGKHLS
jgi:carboxymethylenebutenolidase